MRILLLVLQFPPDVNATGLLMEQVYQDLVTAGHEVSVITTFPHYEKFQIWPEYRGKLAQRAQHKGMDVLRTYVYASGSKQNMLRRLLSYLSYNVLATLAGLFSRRTYDVIVCPNGSFFVGLAAAIIGAPRGIPFIYNVQDLYPEVPVMAGQLRNRHAIAMLAGLERLMYRLSAHVAVIAPSFRENLIGKGVPPAKITMIPNFVDCDFIRPLPKVNAWSQQHGLVDTFVVTHAGNLGYVYDLETMLDAAALLREYSDIVFLIVGDGVAKPGLQQKAQALNLPNVRFLPFQPREMLPWLRATSDVQVSLYKQGSASYSMPSKVYEIMASGRPLLASADHGSDVWSLVEETRCGMCVEPGSAEQLAQAVLTLYRDPSLRAAMGQQGRLHAEQSYSRQAVAAKYNQLIRAVAPKSRAATHAPDHSHP